MDTEPLRTASARGCIVLDGLGMIVFQAADVFGLFTGREPDSARMLADAGELAQAAEVHSRPTSLSSPHPDLA